MNVLLILCEVGFVWSLIGIYYAIKVLKAESRMELPLPIPLTDYELMQFSNWADSQFVAPPLIISEPVVESIPFKPSLSIEFVECLPHGVSVVGKMGSEMPTVKMDTSPAQMKQSRKIVTDEGIFTNHSIATHLAADAIVEELAPLIAKRKRQQLKMKERK